MATLHDLGQKILKIREAINEIDVRGSRNASLIVYAFRTCDEAIGMINTAAEEHEKREGIIHDEQRNSDSSE